MAKLGKMPSKQIIDGFKGLIDFYYWKGIPVARKWPVYQPRQASLAELQTREIFKFLNQIYSTLPVAQIVALTELATGTTLTPKDMLIRLYWKGVWNIMDPPQIATEPTQLLNLTELQDALKTGDLSIQAITKYLEISVKESILPTDAATEAKLVQILARLDAIKLIQEDLVFASRSGGLGHAAGFTLLVNITSKGLLERVEISSDVTQADLRLTIDGQDFRLIEADGSGVQWVRHLTLYQLGGDSAFWKQSVYDTVNNLYALYLKDPIQYNSALYIGYRQLSGGAANVAVTAYYRPLT